MDGLSDEAVAIGVCEGRAMSDEIQIRALAKTKRRPDWVSARRASQSNKRGLKGYRAGILQSTRGLMPEYQSWFDKAV
jgi:hypothetical protein